MSLDTRFGRQLSCLRKEVIAPNFKIAEPGGLEMRGAMLAFGQELKKFSFGEDGKGSMADLQVSLEEKMNRMIDDLSIEGRWKVFLKEKLRSGLLFTSNLVEVAPRVVAAHRSTVDPRNLVKSCSFMDGIREVGLYAGDMGPILDVTFTTFHERGEDQWYVRTSAKDNLRRGHFVEGNFGINSDSEEPGLTITDPCLETLRREMARLKGIPEGGCPAIKVAMADGFGNLLNLMARTVIDVCSAHYDFEVKPDPLVLTSKPDFEFARSHRPYEA